MLSKVDRLQIRRPICSCTATDSLRPLPIAVMSSCCLPLSKATTVQLVVSREIPAMLLTSTPESATACLTAEPSASHQSAGFCSAQAGCGKEVE